MDQIRSYTVEINNHARPQRRFAPLNTDLQPTMYAASQFQRVVAIQNFDGSSYLLSVPLYNWDSVEQAFVRA